MKRRTFLRYGTALAFSYSPFALFANGGHHHGMMAMAQPSSSALLPLMPAEKMPSGHLVSGLLPKLTNQSTQQGVFKGQLIAEPIKLRVASEIETVFWAYNGQLPGPQIEVYEGDTVEIEFINRLPQPTTVHWHGLDVPSEADGNPHDPVEPNGRKLYRFTLSENSAGTYWYHPHPHHYVSEQVYKGLAGTLIVKSRQDPLAHLPEQHWVLSDLRLDQQGKIPPNTMLDWLNGREGDFVLINGQFQPKLQIEKSTRIRIWNATSARYFRLKIEGIKWRVIGTEGGLLPQPQEPQDELFLAPAERVEVLMIGQTQGEVNLQTLYYERHKMMDRSPKQDLNLAQINVKNNKWIDLPTPLRTLPILDEAQLARRVILSETMMDHSKMSNMIPQTKGEENPIPPMLEGMFLINNQSFNMNSVEFVGKVNQVEQWEIINHSHMDHPFHLHGTQFEVIEKWHNGKKIKVDRALKDVVNLRPYEKVIIRFKQGHSGLKMFHCHILEHENLGMMAMLKVE